MKRLLILTIGICLLLTSVPVIADQAEDEAAIRKVVKQSYSALKDRDLKAFMSGFDKNYENWIGTTKGIAAWEKSISEFLNAQKDVQFNLLEEIGILFVTPDVAIYRDRHEVSGLVDADGKQLPTEIRLWAAVYAKKNGKWLRTTQFVRVLEE